MGSLSVCLSVYVCLSLFTGCLFLLLFISFFSVRRLKSSFLFTGSARVFCSARFFSVLCLAKVVLFTGSEFFCSQLLYQLEFCSLLAQLSHSFLFTGAARVSRSVNRLSQFFCFVFVHKLSRVLFLCLQIQPEFVCLLLLFVCLFVVHRLRYSCCCCCGCLFTGSARVLAVPSCLEYPLPLSSSPSRSSLPLGDSFCRRQETQHGRGGEQTGRSGKGRS